MSRYYRTAMGEDGAPPAPHVDSPPPPRGARPKLPPRAAMPAHDDEQTVSATAATAPTRPIVSMPVRRRTKPEKAKRAELSPSAEEAVKKSHRTLLIVGGAVVGVGALLFLSGGARSGRRR